MKMMKWLPIIFAVILYNYTAALAIYMVLSSAVAIAEMCIASAVCIGGPASGPAIASAKGWRDLVIPGVLAGSFGYAIGSFVGISVWEWLR